MLSLCKCRVFDIQFLIVENNARGTKMGMFPSESSGRARELTAPPHFLLPSLGGQC